MPDADDFDVDYFRTLLSGGSEKPRPEAAEPPAKPSPPRTPKKPASKRAAKPKPRRKP